MDRKKVDVHADTVAVSNMIQQTEHKERDKVVHHLAEIRLIQQHVAPGKEIRPSGNPDRPACLGFEKGKCDYWHHSVRFHLNRGQGNKGSTCAFVQSDNEKGVDDKKDKISVKRKKQEENQALLQKEVASKGNADGNPLAMRGRQPSAKFPS